MNGMAAGQHSHILPAAEQELTADWAVLLKHGRPAALAVMGEAHTVATVLAVHKLVLAAHPASRR